MGLGRARADAEVAQQVLAHQVRHLAGHGPMPRFTSGSRKWIGSSWAWQSVMCSRLTWPKRAGRTCRPAAFGGLGRVAVQRQAAGRGDGQHLEEIPAVHGHAVVSVVRISILVDRRFRSTRKATMWVICSGVSQLCSPKRGMLVPRGEGVGVVVRSVIGVFDDLVAVAAQLAEVLQAGPDGAVGDFLLASWWQA